MRSAGTCGADDDDRDDRIDAPVRRRRFESMDTMLARWVIVSVLVLLMGLLVYRLTRPKPPSDELFR
jgi:hypothetical protein